MALSETSRDTPGHAGFEQALVNQLAREMLNEQRRNRRWGIFFKLIFFLYLLLFFIVLGRSGSGVDLGIKGGEHIALVEISGVIAEGVDVSAEDIMAGLRKAFEQEQVQGVLLRINSPGGSPVQAGYVYDEIVRLREERPEVPVYAVIADLCASGGYYIAAAADEIYADKASVVGSIGVIMAGFGFVGAMENLGIERRLLHAGEHKAFMDPFSPLRADHAQHVRELLEHVHGQFKEVVIAGRGERLTITDDVFSGLVWTGEQALEMGLVDGLGSAEYVAREIIGNEDIRDYTVREHYLDSLFTGRFVRDMGRAFAEGLRSHYPALH